MWCVLQFFQLYYSASQLHMLEITDFYQDYMIDFIQSKKSLIFKLQN